MKHGSLRVKCSCKHEYQDSVHGAGTRVATPLNNSRKPPGNRLTTVACTVCGAKHDKFSERDA